MDLMIQNYLERAENEIVLASAIKQLTESNQAKEFMNINSNFTFYSAVISHSYYSIFYTAKAILLKYETKTFSPNVHKKTYDFFKEKLVDTGILDIKLLKIYNKLVIRADELLGIFQQEKTKRGIFTYKTLPQVNKEPAEDSLNNAKTFFSNIKKIIKT